MNKKVIVTLTGFEETASSRFRIRQLFQGLSEKFVVIDASLGKRSFVKRLLLFFAIRTNSPLRHLMRQNKNHIKSADIIIAERCYFDAQELSKIDIFPKPNVIFTADDQDYPPVETLSLCHHALVSNQRIAHDLRHSFNPDEISITPTVVDTKRFCPMPASRSELNFDIVWSGYARNFRYFSVMGDALINIFRTFPEVRLRIVAEKLPKLGVLNRFYKEDRILFERWDPFTEVSAIQKSHLGIMPLTDDLFSRRKAGFKLVQYLSCDLPIICSPVGFNNEILMKLDNPNISSASNPEDWVHHLEHFIRNRTKTNDDGRWRKIVIDHFSINENLQVWNELLEDII